MKVLITGGTGFIGSYLIDAIGQKADVRILTRKSDLPDQKKDVSCFSADLSEPEALLDALEGVDTVVHLAGAPRHSDSNLLLEMDPINLQLLMKQMIEKKVKRIIYLSSGGVIYAPSLRAHRESDPKESSCPYGESKLKSEKILLEESSLFETVILRPSNCFGPRTIFRHNQGLIENAMKTLKRGESFEIWGNGSETRDYLYVTDLARAIALVVLSDFHEGIFNIGSERGKSIDEVLDQIENAAKMKFHRIYRNDLKLGVEHNVLDCSRFKKCGWSPQVSFEEGIRLTWEWISKQSF